MPPKGRGEAHEWSLVHPVPGAAAMATRAPQGSGCAKGLQAWKLRATFWALGPARVPSMLQYAMDGSGMFEFACLGGHMWCIF